MSNGHPQTKEPRIPIGTIEEFEMLGLLLREPLCNMGSEKASDVITVPSSAAVKLVLRILKNWNIPESEHARVLGMTFQLLEMYKQEGNYPVAKIELQRLEDILVMHKALMVLFPNNPEFRNGWCTSKNAILGDRRPIDIILMEGTSDIRRHLERALSL